MSLKGKKKAAVSGSSLEQLYWKDFEISQEKIGVVGSHVSRKPSTKHL